VFRNVIILAVGLLISLAAGGLYYQSRTAPQAQSPAAPDKAKDDRPQPVYVTTVQRGSIHQSITATGDILAAAKVDVYSKAEGRLQAIEVEPGDRVQRDQIIARIDDAELQATMERTAAELDILQAEWAQMQAGERPEDIARASESVRRAQAERDNAQRELERAQALYERGLYATQQLDGAKLLATQARAALTMAEKQLRIVRSGARIEDRQALQARLRAAKASLRLTQTQRQNAVITAPMTGIISHRYVDLGAYITDTTIIATLVDMQTVELEVPIGERDIGRIQPGLHAQVRVDTYPDDVFFGTVTRLSPTIDLANRSANVEIAIDNADLRLKPGMFAKMTLILRQRDDTLLVPRQAVHFQDDQATLFVVQEGKAHRRQVTTGLQNDRQIEILDHLEAGATIVIAGHNQLKDQASVVVIEQKDGA